MSILLTTLMFMQVSAETSNLGEPLLVRKESFKCLVDQIDRLKLQGRDLRIDIRKCPIEIVTAYSPPLQLKLRPSSKLDTVESTLVLDASRVACIRRHRGRINKYAVSYGDYFLIDLKRCAKPIQ